MSKVNLKGRGRSGRHTEIKIRVTPLKRMPKSVLFRKIVASAQSGVIDPDISVEAVGYEHTHRGRSTGNDSLADTLQALRDFARVLNASDSVEVE